jgi:Flp pilus assembly pilin Flp
MLGLLLRGIFDGRGLIRAFPGERGQGLVEYALIIFGIALVVIASLAALSGTLEGFFCTVATAFGAECAQAGDPG